MPMFTELLTIWEIAFRWAGKDPDRRWFRLPLDVRDNFRLIVEAILYGHLLCTSLRLEKWSPADGEENRQYFIRYHWPALEACLGGKSYDRKFLRHGIIDRYDFYEWCKGWAIEPPAFWFPPGAKLQFESRREQVASGSDEDEGEKVGGRPAQRACVACQVIARNLWKAKPDMTIAAMIKHEAIQQLGGGAYYADAVVRRWIKVVAPAKVREKRGRPPKKKGTRSDSST